MQMSVNVRVIRLILACFFFAYELPPLKRTASDGSELRAHGKFPMACTHKTRDTMTGSGRSFKQHPTGTGHVLDDK